MLLSVSGEASRSRLSQPTTSDNQLLSYDELREQRMNRIVAEVNANPTAGWEATDHISWEFFEGKPMSLNRATDPARSSIPAAKVDAASQEALPTGFDWRLQTPYCVGYIRNQVYKLLEQNGSRFALLTYRFVT